MVERYFFFGDEAGSSVGKRDLTFCHMRLRAKGPCGGQSPANSAVIEGAPDQTRPPAAFSVTQAY